MEERIARGKAIRLKCLDCCCGNSAEVRRCPTTKCPLWRYRDAQEMGAVRERQAGAGEEKPPARIRRAGGAEALPQIQNLIFVKARA